MADHADQQGTITPRIFIGMGGAGSRIVDRIAARAERLPNWESHVRALTAFISVDTNDLDLNQLLHIPHGCRLRIGAFNKPAVVDGYRKNKNMQALHWLDRAYQPRAGIKPGAGQIRVESRLGFFYESPNIRKRLTEIEAEIRRAGNFARAEGKFYIYLYTTLAGGTGSGSFLPMTYLVQDVIRRSGWQPRVIGNLLLSTVMLDSVSPDLHARIHANTYAALKELEHLNKLNYDQVKKEGRLREQFAFWHREGDDEVPTVNEAPFFISLLYDQPPGFSVADYEAVVADAAYLQLFTPNIDAVAGALDNYETSLAELTQLPGDLRNVGLGYSKNFGCVGTSALTLPADDLLQYCALRFAAEAVRSQITFGVDPSDPADDRARAMAKLAVNYSDPAFMRMGDDGRNSAINFAFLRSVREMARLDEVEDLRDGFWFQLVEGVDQGRVTGTDDKGEIRRGESMLDLVRRQLGEARRKVVDKISIKEKAFAFQREGVNQYGELLSRLKEDIRVSRAAVQAELDGLKRGAEGGEVVAARKLDPITERYLVLRLLEECEQKWIPLAQEQFNSASKKDINSPSVNDRFEELRKSLDQAAAGKGRLGIGRGSDEPFIAVRNEAEEYYRSISSAARKVVDAEIALGQFRGLLAYLQERARQYASLAREMNSLMTKLIERAEKLRTGQAGSPRLALSVEVFETLEQPRERIWDRVWKALFVDRGKYLSTFDRSSLAQCFSDQLKPVVRADGAVVAKQVPQLVSDIGSALERLGFERLRDAILGGPSDPGVDLQRGLEIEAILMLEAAAPKGSVVESQNIEEYIERKIRALSQISGVLARTASDEWRARGDGVINDRGRRLMHGFGREADTSEFVQKLKSVLQRGNRQVTIVHWDDPRLVTVFDVEMPIAAYYVNPVIDEIQKAYLAVQADERRGYHLHIDYHWEESLPNLDPRASEVEVGWAISLLCHGLVSGRIRQVENGSWVWDSSLSDAPEPLGQTLSAALYRVGEYYRSQELRSVLETDIRGGLAAMNPTEQAQRRRERAEDLKRVLAEIALHQQRGEIQQEDVLDRPVLRALIRLLEDAAEAPARVGGYRLRS